MEECIANQFEWLQWRYMRQLTGNSVVCSKVCKANKKPIKTRVPDPLWKEPTSDKGIPLTK